MLILKNTEMQTDNVQEPTSTTTTTTTDFVAEEEEEEEEVNPESKSTEESKLEEQN